jgi:hypothetical protein
LEECGLSLVSPVLDSAKSGVDEAWVR